jgi:hypothetical protein
MKATVGKTYVRMGDACRRRVTSITPDRNYPSGYLVRFIVWGGPPHLRPGEGASDLSVFNDNTELEVNEDPPKD